MDQSEAAAGRGKVGDDVRQTLPSSPSHRSHGCDKRLVQEQPRMMRQQRCPLTEIKVGECSRARGSSGGGEGHLGDGEPLTREMVTIERPLEPTDEKEALRNYQLRRSLSREHAKSPLRLAQLGRDEPLQVAREDSAYWASEPFEIFREQEGAETGAALDGEVPHQVVGDVTGRTSAENDENQAPSPRLLHKMRKICKTLERLASASSRIGNSNMTTDLHVPKRSKSNQNLGQNSKLGSPCEGQSSTSVSTVESSASTLVKRLPSGALMPPPSAKRRLLALSTRSYSEPIMEIDP